MKKDAIKATMTKVVDDLIALVESSDGNWLQPWVNLGLGKQVRSTGELYRGTNQMFLGFIAASKALEQPHIWAGYNTWVTMGYRVRPGEKSSYRPIYASLVRTCTNHGSRKEDGRCCGDMTSFMRVKLLRAIFHLTQVEAIEGEVQTLPEVGVEPPPTVQPPEIVEAWKAGGMEFKEVDSDRAYFSPGDDYINLPPLGAFENQQGYYSTLFHEATHWTGHKSRLGRKVTNPFGTAAYAQEELIAEMGSAMTGAVLGFEPDLHAEHADYLANWLKVIKADPTKLYDAAVEAEKASHLLLKLGEVDAIAA